MSSYVIRTRNHYRPGAWKWIVGILIVVGALMTYQQYYYRQRLPLVRAARVEADREGPAIFEEIGTPPGSEPQGGGEKRYGTGGRRSSWQGEPTGIVWERDYETPGNLETIAEWYRQRLLEKGWRSFDDTPPSIVQREFKRGKWIVRIGARGEWPSPLRTRINVELKWDYQFRAD